MLTVDRKQVLAYRVAAQGLDAAASAVGDLAVLDIGVQDGPGEQARLSFANRLAKPPSPDAVGPGHRLALVWSLRGAPHVHRRKDLDALAEALFPLSEADAAGRLNETGPSVERAGITALEQFERAVDAMHDVVARPKPKGETSTAVTKRLPETMRRNCRACGTSHISDSAMRVSSLAAGLELEPGTAPPVLHPRAKARRPRETDVAALRRLFTDYLRLLGPATEVEVAGYVEARRADARAAWPDDLVEVRVDGRTAWIPADAARALEGAPEPKTVRLLGGFDPFLQARDRALLVPDKAAQKTLWPVLGRPGAVLAHGEIVGAWRPKTSGTKLTITVEPFGALAQDVWDALEPEAERVAAVRGAGSVTLARG
ncbi:MAG: DNA glycosylase AlkZ-like family protein [Jatrophihabitans sp.]|uniref:DNA glycosylase AlkZ-like family protein n=1 Tax=Jatrophihabitans sp. TaxID=1932789 RepID=UPI003F8128D4